MEFRRVLFPIFALPLGATLRRTGVNFAIFSKHATSCTLVLLQPGAEHPFVEFALDPRSNRTGQVWHVFVEGLDAGMQYGYRFDMQPNPNPVRSEERRVGKESIT